MGRRGDAVCRACVQLGRDLSLLFSLWPLWERRVARLSVRAECTATGGVLVCRGTALLPVFALLEMFLVHVVVKAQLYGSRVRVSSSAAYPPVSMPSLSSPKLSVSLYRCVGHNDRSNLGRALCGQFRACRCSVLLQMKEQELKVAKSDVQLVESCQDYQSECYRCLEF